MLSEQEGDLQYFKSSQFIPTKGESFHYYECDEDLQVKRYLTHIPDTGEVEKIDVTWTMEMRRERAEEISREEFMEQWEREEQTE